MAFYLPPVSEVYNVHEGLLDVPVQVLRAVLLLQMNGEGQLIALPTGLRRRLRRERGTRGQAGTQPEQSDGRPAGHSSSSLTFITHLRDADSPAAHAPHLVRQLEFHHVLLDARQVILQIAVLLLHLQRK